MSTPDEADMELYDLRVTVHSIEGRSVCGLSVGDYIELTESSRAPPRGGPTVSAARRAVGVGWAIRCSGPVR
jgi:uncharacterized repeat protein (TIGR04076 family)